MKRRGSGESSSSKRGAVPSRPPRGASRATTPSAGGEATKNMRRPTDGQKKSSAPTTPVVEEKAPRPRRARTQAPMANASWTFGIRAVESAIESAAVDVEELWIQSAAFGTARARVWAQAEAAGLRIREVDAGRLERLLGDDANHQGVAARLTAFTYADVDEVLGKEGPQLIVVLDEVQDPHNLGAILRSAVGLGASAVVIPKHRAVGVTPTVRKVSTGAAEKIPVVRATNLARFLEQAQAAGFWIYGTVVDEGEALDQVEFSDRAVLVMGSEGSGMRPLIRRGCDRLIHLPIDGVESLNVSVACGIFLYAWRRQRALSTG